MGAGSVHVRVRDVRRREEARRLLARALRAPVAVGADPFVLTARMDDLGPGNGAAEQASYALAVLAASGIVVDDFSLARPSLDEVFLTLTDRPAGNGTGSTGTGTGRNGSSGTGGGGGGRTDGTGTGGGSGGGAGIGCGGNAGAAA